MPPRGPRSLQRYFVISPPGFFHPSSPHLTPGHLSLMACCKICCGCADCTEGQEGKCCCGGQSGECCQPGEVCCDGVCTPGDSCCECETAEDCAEGQYCCPDEFGGCSSCSDEFCGDIECQECTDAYGYDDCPPGFLYIYAGLGWDFCAEGRCFRVNQSLTGEAPPLNCDDCVSEPGIDRLCIEIPFP